MIHLSKAASSEIKRLQSCRPNSNNLLRLGVQTGGCAGMLYTIEFDEVLQAEDIVYDCSDIRVVVDSQQSKFLIGLTLDYSEDLMGGAFRFDNPNTLQSCSCGNSFSLTE